SVVAVLIFAKLVSIPGKWSHRKIFLDTVISPLREGGIVVEKIIALQLEQRLRNFQFTGVRHGMRHVIELRRVIDGPEESRQIIKEGIVASADIGLDGEAIRCIDGQHPIDIDDGRKTTTREINKSDRCPAGLIDGNSYLRG